MTQFALFSDLHVDIEQWDISLSDIDYIEANADFLIIAGDTSDDAISSIRWMGERFKNIPLIWVWGNHEIFNENMFHYETLEDAKRITSLEYKNITLLDRDVKTIGDIDILGCTLWSDIIGDKNSEDNKALFKWYNYERKNVPHTTEEVNKTANILQNKYILDKNWLNMELLTRGQQKKIVVTHHPPLFESVLIDPHAAIILPLMGSNLLDLFEYENIKCWVHGHIHHQCDYIYNKTRVISNPRGATPFLNNDFSPVKIINI